MGGLVTSKITETLAAVVSTKSEIDKMSSKMAQIQEADIEVSCLNIFWILEYCEYKSPTVLLQSYKTLWCLTQSGYLFMFLGSRRNILRSD